jgi:hypothetical protein
VRDVYSIFYPIELEIKNTTDTDRSASYLDIHLEIDSEIQIGLLYTLTYTSKLAVRAG